MLRFMKASGANRKNIDVRSPVLRNVVQALDANTIRSCYVSTTAGLKFGRMPRRHSKEFYLWKHLERGAAGRCYVASTTKRFVACAIKMCLLDPKARASPTALMERAKAEAKNWRDIYGLNVRSLKLNGQPAVLMPLYWPFPEEQRAAHADEVETALRAFTTLNTRSGEWFRHDDLSWRHILLKNPDAAITCDNIAFIDLDRVQRMSGGGATQRDAWIASSMAALRAEIIVQ